MRIVKNNVGIQIELTEFLEVLESGLFDDLLLFLIELDSTDELDQHEEQIVQEFELGYIFEGPMGVNDMNRYLDLIEDAIEEAHEQIMNSLESGEFESLEIDSNEPVQFKKPKPRAKKSTVEDSRVKNLLSKYEGL